MSFREQRRYSRVQVLKSLGGLVPEMSAQVTWPNLETSSVMDLSYKGMAVRRPGLFPIDIQQNVKMSIELGGQPPFTVESRIAWCNLDWVGLEFGALSAEGHQSMRVFLDAKLVGASLLPVQRIFVGNKETFQFWYQGHGRAHVYIWMTPEDSHRKPAVERVVVDLDGDVFEFLRGSQLKLNARNRRAFLVLSQMDKADHPMEEFVRHLLLGA